MLKKWLDWLAADTAAPEQSPEKRLQRALCVLLLEAAAADGHMEPEELRRVGDMMRDRFELDHAEVRELLAEAEEARAESVGLFEYTNELNRQFSPEERLRVMEDIWRVIYADGSLNPHEDHLAHKLMDLLRLNHRQFITAKLRVVRGDG